MKFMLSLAVLIIVAGSVGCKRSSTGPTAAQMRAEEARFAGEYGITEETLDGGVYGQSGGVKIPDAANTIPWTAPQIMIRSDKSFVMHQIPVQWQNGLSTPKEVTLEINGNWTLGDDGDGSLEATLDINKVNGRDVQGAATIRLGDPALLIMKGGPSVSLKRRANGL